MKGGCLPTERRLVGSGPVRGVIAPENVTLSFVVGDEVVGRVIIGGDDDLGWSWSHCLPRHAPSGQWGRASLSRNETFSTVLNRQDCTVSAELHFVALCSTET